MFDVPCGATYDIELVPLFNNTSITTLKDDETNLDWRSLLTPSVNLICWVFVTLKLADVFDINVGISSIPFLTIFKTFPNKFEILPFWYSEPFTDGNVWLADVNFTDADVLVIIEEKN